MCLQKSTGIIILLAALAVLSGCGALDAILPSTGTYKINAKVNDTPLDDFSIVTSKDKILPFFEEPVSEDPDITEFVVYLKDSNSRGLVTGYKVTYSLNNKDKENEPELQIVQDNSTTEKKDDKKKDETATTVTDEKKKDETVTTAADKNKDSADDKKKDDAVTTTATTTDKNKESAGDDKKKDDAVTTVTATDKNKESSGNVSTKSNDEKKETIVESIDTALEKIEHTKNGNLITFPVKSLDDALPFFPLPSDLPIGKYTLVFQVMGKNTVLYKYEKLFFYIADAEFSFDGIQVNLPGIAENSQFIQNGNVILLDINLNFDSRLEPYVVWYNGKKIIDEGRYSDGAGTLLWKAPEQNGFVSLRAEVFPSWERTGLAGYQRGISLLVSSKEIDMHLLSEDMPDLLQWYTFEGDLNESLTKDTEKLTIEPAGKNKLNWMPSSGTYGLASGTDNAFKLPDILFTNNEGEDENWQIISRFKPLGEGEIFSVQFGPAFDVTMTLSNKKSNLVLTLASASKTSSEQIKLPDEKDSFITVSVKILVQEGQLSAKLAYLKPAFAQNNNYQNEPIINPISIDAFLDKEIKITLGSQKKPLADKDNTQTTVVQNLLYTALWDELAVLRLPEVEIITIKEDTKEAPKEAPAEETPVEESSAEETAVIEAEPPETITPPPPPPNRVNLQIL